MGSRRAPLPEARVGARHRLRLRGHARRRDRGGSARGLGFAVMDERGSIAPTTAEDRAIATLVTAFANDAVTRWFLRDAHFYLTYWPRLIRALGGAAFD